MDVKNFGIYGYIDHKYKNHNVRLVGKVVKLNESDQTCRMCFKSKEGKNIFEDGIPMESVMIEEGVFDNMKKRFGSGIDNLKSDISRISTWAKTLYKKVGGLVRTVVHGKVMPYTNSVMIGQYAALGELPPSVTVVLSDDVKAVASEQNVTVKDQRGIEKDDPEELKQMNDFLKEVIARFKSKNPVKPNMEAFKTAYLESINESYGMNAVRLLTENNQIDRFFNIKKYNMLHEDVELVGDDVNDPGRSLYASNHMSTVTAPGIIDRLQLQLDQTFKVEGFGDQSKDIFQNALDLSGVTKDDYDSDPDVKEIVDKIFKDMSAKIGHTTESPKSFHPLLIWGAPGIGKTQIVHECIGLFNQMENKKLSCLDVPLQMESRDSFMLQGYLKNSKGENVGAGEFIESWLPMYHESAISDEENRIGNLAANARMRVDDYREMESMNQKAKIDGGILFFDELLRAQKDVIDIVMKLLDERRLGEYVLGNHWIMCAATNRPWELGGRDVQTEFAWSRRFQNVTFVPTIDDWVKWAEGYDYDPIAREYSDVQGAPRIEQSIIDFIKSQGESVFYEVLTDDNNKQENARQISKATPASWEYVSNGALAASRDAAARAHKKWNPYRRNTQTGKLEYEPENLTNAERLQATADNIGKDSNVYKKYANYLDISRHFTPTVIDNIWKFGSLSPSQKIYIPQGVNASIAGEPGMPDRVFSLVYTPERVLDFTKNIKSPADIKIFNKFNGELTNVVWYFANYLNACGNISQASRQAFAKNLQYMVFKGMDTPEDNKNKDSYYKVTSYQVAWCLAHGEDITKAQDFKKNKLYQEDVFHLFCALIACFEGFSNERQVIDQYFGRQNKNNIGKDPKYIVNWEIAGGEKDMDI